MTKFEKDRIKDLEKDRIKDLEKRLNDKCNSLLKDNNTELDKFLREDIKHKMFKLKMWKNKNK